MIRVRVSRGVCWVRVRPRRREQRSGGGLCVSRWSKEKVIQVGMMEHIKREISVMKMGFLAGFMFLLGFVVLSFKFVFDFFL